MFVVDSPVKLGSLNETVDFFQACASASLVKHAESKQQNQIDFTNLHNDITRNFEYTIVSEHERHEKLRNVHNKFHSDDLVGVSSSIEEYEIDEDRTWTVPLNRPTDLENRRHIKAKLARDDDIINTVAREAFPLQANYNKMKVADLKDICKARGLDSVGSKKQLIDRLENKCNASAKEKESVNSKRRVTRLSKKSKK